MLRKLILGFLIFLVSIVIVYLLGPKVNYPRVSYNSSLAHVDISNVEAYIADKEDAIPDLKQDNEARIIWYDSVGRSTEYALVYLHGFSASQEEGDPLHEEFAKRYGMNLYLPRLHDHGRVDSNSFKGLTPQLLFDSAVEAIEIGKTLGKKIILMSCSTGGTLDIMLTKHYPEIAGHIMYSPNISIADLSAKLVTYPWGEQILELVMKGEINHVQYKEEAKPYWSEAYHTDGILALQTILDQSMNEESFKSITQPLFVGAYYKDEDHQDKVVSVDAMKDFFEKVSTPDSMKVYIEFPNAGRHVISSHIFSEDLEAVRESTFKFAEEKLKLKEITSNKESL